MANYHLSKKGEDFIDGHYREFEGTADVSPDRVIEWLWWIRESEDFTGTNLKLIKDVGNKNAGFVVNWAIQKGYLEKDWEPDENPWADEERKEREDWERTSQVDYSTEVTTPTTITPKFRSEKGRRILRERRGRRG